METLTAPQEIKRSEPVQKKRFLAINTKIPILDRIIAGVNKRVNGQNEQANDEPVIAERQPV